MIESVVGIYFMKMQNFFRIKMRFLFVSIALVVGMIFAFQNCSNGFSVGGGNGEPYGVPGPDKLVCVSDTNGPNGNLVQFIIRYDGSKDWAKIISPPVRDEDIPSLMASGFLVIRDDLPDKQVYFSTDFELTLRINQFSNGLAPGEVDYVDNGSNVALNLSCRYLY